MTETNTIEVAEINGATPYPHYAEEFLRSLDAPALIDLLVANEDRVPLNIIEECARRDGSMVDCLREIVEGDRCWSENTSTGEWWLLLHAAMILGRIPGERAGLTMLDLMRRMSSEEDDALQDWLAADWPRLLANKGAAFMPALREFCADRDLDWYIRACAVEAVLALGQEQGNLALDQTIDWLAVIAADETEAVDIRMTVGNSLLDFPRERHRPLLESLLDLQEDEMRFFDMSAIDSAFVASVDAPSWQRFGEPWRFYSPDAMRERQLRWANEDKDDREHSEPYVRATSKTGRNDPCPCGSGRKYKKCCLSKDEDSDFLP